jgi:DNA polymerase-3 subunit alpha
MGIKVLAPDVNESIGFFAAVGEDIRFGMGAIRNVGFNVVEQVIQSRTEKGRFTSFHDFLNKVPLGVANKRTVESLIKAGAFDTLGSTRRSLLEVHEASVDKVVKDKRAEANGDFGFDFDSLFDEPQESSQVPPKPEWSKKQKLAFEREMLGLYVSDHPLAGLEAVLAKNASTSIADLLALETPPDGEQVTLAGLVTEVQHRVARNSGNQYGIVQIEDFGGTVSVMFLGKAYQEFAPTLVADSVVVVRGRVSARDDGINIHANSLMMPDLGSSGGSGPVMITLPDVRATTATVRSLSDVLRRNSGETEVRLRLTRGETARIFEIPFPVRVTADLYGELKSLLGPACV